MVFFFSKDRSEKMSLYAALQRVYGLGKYTIFFLIGSYGFKHNISFKKISFKILTKMEKWVEKNFVIEVDLRRKKKNVIDVLRKQNLYAGLRHRQFLPIHFQRTHSNANSIRYKYQPRKKTKKGKFTFSKKKKCL